MLFESASLAAEGDREAELIAPGAHQNGPRRKRAKGHRSGTGRLSKRAYDAAWARGPGMGRLLSAVLHGLPHEHPQRGLARPGRRESVR